LVANHDVRIRAQQGPPKPCRIPFRAQKVQNQAIPVPAPKAMLTAAVAMSPPASMRRGEERAPRTPETNFDMP